MRFTILDCYTDEPAGLGVPPYIGTYPRYIAGQIKETNKENEVHYTTIDDFRALQTLGRRLGEGGWEVSKKEFKKEAIKTNIKIKNLSKNFPQLNHILQKTDYLIIIAGVHTPGKYLSAVPGTVVETRQLLSNLNICCKTILTGPAAHCGSGLFGGRMVKVITEGFDYVFSDLEYYLSDLIKTKFDIRKTDTEVNYKKISKSAVLGAEIVKQYPDFEANPDFFIAEIETSKGCTRGIGCSFCTEPIKNKLEFREQKDIIEEAKALKKAGINNFRIGKQSCFYSYKNGSPAEIEKLLKPIAELNPKVLHIDNVNPAMVVSKDGGEITKLIVKYCTAGNVAAFGVESFDPIVIKENNLNSNPEITIEAARIINKYGAERGDNGMPKFLPGINILFGLAGESKKTHEENMFWLKKIADDGLLLRRINIREVAVFPETMLYKTVKDKFLRKNRKYYWKWRNQIRQEIDFLMLQRLLPKGAILRNLRTEIYDGNTTFCRQIGTYPLVTGVKERLKLDEFIDIRVTGHMLRSIIGEKI